MPKHPTQEAPLSPDVEGALFAALKPAVVSPERAARLRQKIDAALAVDARQESGVVTHKLDDDGWIRRSPDYEIKIVNHDAATGLYSYLLRLAANGSIESHPHHSTEECVILSGEVEVDGLTLRAGDYQMLQPGTRHARIHTRTGALLFLRSELQLAA
jgi:hypothetical protein